MATADQTTDARLAVPAARADGRLPLLLLAGVIVLGFAIIVLATRDFVLYADDWELLQGRYQGGVESLLEAYNGHLMAVSVFAFKVLGRLAGLDTHWPYMALLIAVHMAAVAGVFVIARRRMGAWPALFVAAPLAVLGSAWESLMWPASLNFVAFTAASVFAWLALDRRDRRGELGALTFALIATFSSGAAPCLSLALAAELAVQRRWRSMWVPGIPLLVFAVWLAIYGDGGDATLDSIAGMPQFAAEMAATAVGGLLGQSVNWGYTPLMALLAVGGWLAVRRPAAITPRLIGLVVALLSFWVLTGAVRGGQAGASASRYVEVGAVFLALALAELGTVRFDRRLVVALGVVGLLATIGNLGQLHYGIDRFGALNDEVAARIGAFDLAPDRAPADFAMAPGLGTVPIAEPYRKLTRLTGERGGPSPDRIATFSPQARASADAILGQLAVISRPARRGQGCTPAGTAERELAPGAGFAVRAGDGEATVTLRRFGDEGGGVKLPVAAGTTLAVTTTRDRATDHPWRVKIEGAGAASCTAAG